MLETCSFLAMTFTYQTSVACARILLIVSSLSNEQWV
jgi:hypothetical protein